MKNTNKLAAIAFLIIAMVNQGFSQSCAIPTGLAAAPINSTTEKLTWHTVAGANSYQVQVDNESPNTSFFHLENTVSDTFLTVSGLTANARYKFKVRSNCGSTHSNYSPAIAFNAGSASSTCGIPATLAPTNITSSGARLRWTSTGATSYRVRIEDASGNNVDYLRIVNTSALFFDITGLNSSSNYKFKVRSNCNGTIGPWSAWRNFTTSAPRLSNTNDEVSTQVNVYPNPATDEINISFGEMSTLNTSVAVYDLAGKLMFTKNLTSEGSTQKLSVVELPDGLYNVVITKGNETFNKKISISK